MNWSCLKRLKTVYNGQTSFEFQTRKRGTVFVQLFNLPLTARITHTWRWKLPLRYAR